MDRIRASNKGSLASVLEWWIEDAEPDQGSVVSRLTKECISVFRKLMKKLPKEAGISRETFRRLERSCSSLILWDSGYDVVKGGLDDALGKSRTLRRSTLGHLINISRALADRVSHLINLKDEELGPYRALSSTTAEAETHIHEGYQGGSDTDDSDSDSSSISLSSDWDEIAEDIWTDVHCLLDLDPLIKFPAPDIVQVSQDNQKAPVEWKPHVVYTDRIRARFPRADPSLADRLGRANWERFLKGNADREKNQNGSLESAGIEVAATNAHCTEAISQFHDSGLGTSINTGSAYAETVMSYRREGGESVRIPPLPKEAKQGKPFECVACGRKLAITNSSTWKKHLYLDLCPWICHEIDCTYGTQLFRNREDWIQHIGLEHGLYPEWKSFACPMCHEDTGKGKIAITRHLSSHMEEISLAALPAGIETDDESESYGDDTSSVSYDKWECRACGHAVSSGVIHICCVREDEKVEGLSADTGIHNDTPSSKKGGWDAHKATIIKLYKTENMTLAQIRDIMAKDYNFKAGIRTYRIRLKKWGVRRYRKHTEGPFGPPSTSPIGLRHGSAPSTGISTENVYTSGEQYKCTLDQCKDQSVIWPHADNFRSHLRSVHGMLPENTASLAYLDQFLCESGQVHEEGSDLVPEGRRGTPRILQSGLSANLVSRRSLLTLGLEANERQRRLSNITSHSTSVIHRPRGVQNVQGVEQAAAESTNDSDDSPLMMEGTRQGPLKPTREAPRTTRSPS